MTEERRRHAPNVPRDATRRALVVRGCLALAGVVGSAGCSTLGDGNGTATVGGESDAGTGRTATGTNATPGSPGTTGRPTPVPGIGRTALAESFPEVRGRFETFRGTAARTGALPGPAPGSDLRPRWRIGLESGTRGVAVADGRVVFATVDGRVVALSASDGRPRWATRVGSTNRSVPAVADGTVYVASAGGTIAALDLGDGRTRWTTEVAVPLYSCPAVVDDRLVLGAKYGVYALSTNDGSVVWQFENGERFEGSSPAVAGGRVVIGSGGRAPGTGTAVYCLDAATGEQRWTRSAESRVWSTPAVVPETASGGHVYVGVDDGSADGTVLALDLADGGAVWRGDRGVDGAVTVTDDRVLVPGDPIRAHDRAEGTVAWAAGAGTPLARGGTAYAGPVARAVANGSERFAVETSVSPAHATAVTRNALFVLSRKRRVGAAGRRLEALSAPG